MLTSTMSAPMSCDDSGGIGHLDWIATEDLNRNRALFLGVFGVSSVRSMPRTSPSDETISVTTSPQPPCRLTRRRNAVSVMPAIGATTNGEGSSIEPIFMCVSVRTDVCRVDFDADSLPDQIHREDEARFVVLPDESSNDTRQRTVNHFNHHALTDHRARIVREVALARGDGFRRSPAPESPPARPQMK